LSTESETILLTGSFSGSVSGRGTLSVGRWRK